MILNKCVISLLQNNKQINMKNFPELNDYLAILDKSDLKVASNILDILNDAIECRINRMELIGLINSGINKIEEIREFEDEVEEDRINEVCSRGDLDS